MEKKYRAYRTYRTYVFLYYPQSTEPPLTLRISPVMLAAQSDARKTTARAMSSAVATRPSGIVSTIFRLNGASPKTTSFNSVSTQPGATLFTRMVGASSAARDLVNLIWPSFDAAEFE